MHGTYVLITFVHAGRPHEETDLTVILRQQEDQQLKCRHQT